MRLRRKHRPARAGARPSLICVASLLLYLAAPASAQAAFSFIGTISGAGAQGPQIAVAPNGDAVFGWSRHDGGCCWRAYARGRSASGVLGPVQTLSPPGQSAILEEVGIDADGDAVFVWYTPDSVVRTRTRSAAGTLSPIQTLSKDASQNPQVAVAPNGRAVFAWAAGGRIRTRARSPAGTLSGVQTVSGFRGDYPDVAVDSDGDAVFIWRSQGTDADYCHCFQTRARSAAGTLSAVQILSERVAYPNPQVDVDSDGDAVFAWTRQGSDYGLLAETRTRSASGTLSPVRKLSATESIHPDVGIDADGDAVFVWRELCPGSVGGSSCGIVRARARSAAFVFSPIQTLSTTSDLGIPQPSPHVAVDAAGNAVFTWSGDDDTTQCGGGGACERIFARSRSAAGALSPLQILSPGGQDAVYDRVAVNAHGDAAAAWQRNDGTSASCCWRIQAAVQPAP